MSRRFSAIFLNPERKVRNIWWVIIFFLILSAFLFPLIFLAEYYHFEITPWQQVAIILAASVLCQAFRRKPQRELIGKIDRSWLRQLWIGMIVGAALMFLPASLLTVFGAVHWGISDFPVSIILSEVLLMAGVVVAEELLFRGFIFQRLIGAFGTWPAQLIIAGLFLLTHLNNPGMTGVIKLTASVNIFIASILFGVTYIKTKTLAMPLGLHFMANVVQGTVMGFGVSGEKETSVFIPTIEKTPDWVTGGAFGLEASVVGLIILILTTISLYRNSAISNLVFDK